SRIIPADDPLTRWHFRNKGPQGETELAVVGEVSRIIRRLRPDIRTLYAPITRRAPIRCADTQLDIVQTWSYSPGLRVVWLQELGEALVRGSGIRSSSFPGFLD